jgi:hypothetical protein
MTYQSLTRILKIKVLFNTVMFISEAQQNTTTPLCFFLEKKNMLLYNANFCSQKC